MRRAVRLALANRRTVATAGRIDRTGALRARGSRTAGGLRRSRVRANASVSRMPRFAELAVDPDATLDLLGLAMAAEFGEVDAAGAMASLDALGTELLGAAKQTSGTPEAQALACGQMFGVAHGFLGDREQYDAPQNSMLDLVLRGVAAYRYCCPSCTSRLLAERGSSSRASDCRATSWSVTSVQTLQCYWIPSPAAYKSRPTSRRTT